MKRGTKNFIMVSIIVLMIIVSYLMISSMNNKSVIMPPEIPSMPSSENSSTKETTQGDIVGGRHNRKNDYREKMHPRDFDNQRHGDTVMTNSPPSMPNNNTSLIQYVVLGINAFVISSILVYLILSKGNKKGFKETFQDSDKVIISVLGTILLTGALTFTSILLTKNISSNPMNNNMGMPGGNNSVSYSSSKEITSNEEITSGSYTSNTKDENAISVSGKVEATLSNIEVSKTGDSNGGDNTSFYGTNSAIIAKDGANVTIKNANITTDATGANGVFSYGGSATTNNSSSDGTIVNISDSTITTSKDNSGGIMTTGGGVMNATNLNITTAGTSSAAIRTDRGGGVVTADGGTYKTTGKGSPAIYSTANITVKNATLIATASEGAIIEGKNSITLENVELTDTNNELNGQSTTYKNVFLYQSMSGDAATGEAVFTAKNSTITTNNGDSFYVTNTTATINLENNTIQNYDSTGNFLRIKADSWGNSGNNGGVVTLNMTNQKVTGNIVVDNISTLKMVMKDSYFEGSINSDNTAKEIVLKLDSSSVLNLTGNCYVTSLIDADTSYSNINFNGFKLYVNGKAIN